MRASWTAAALALCLLVPGGHARAQASESEVVWYTAMNTQEADALRRIFEKKYPFLTLTVLRQPGEKLRTRILSEARARKRSWDVVSFNLLDMDALAEEGLLASYVSPETRSGFPKGAVDPGGRWAALYVRLYVLGFNTRLVPPGKIPWTGPSCSEPQWKGRARPDDSDVEWYASMLDYSGREGQKFRALARGERLPSRPHLALSACSSRGIFRSPWCTSARSSRRRKTARPSIGWSTGSHRRLAQPDRDPVGRASRAARLFVDFQRPTKASLPFASAGACRRAPMSPARATRPRLSSTTSIRGSRASSARPRRNFGIYS
jgi:hypothetical protein